PTAMAVAEGDTLADIPIALRGNVHHKGDLVRRGFLQALTFGPMPTIGPKSSGRRELAEWIASADNPLTARVAVNRVWHHLFGAGLVRTVDNFGATGEAPSHPELLDYLALRFIDKGWSLKMLIREIVLSRAFQQASAVSTEATAAGLAVDPENRLLWRQNRRRVDAETLRDTMLLVSGQLDRTLYGNNIAKGTTIERDYVFADTRRSIYTPVFRNRLHELFEVFDFPDPNMVVGKRNVSTVPTQALYLMNNPWVLAQAKSMADNLLKRHDGDDAGRLDLFYRQALGRGPTDRERALALAYLGRWGKAADRRLAWEQICQAVLACVDFRYVD
ncbi:MAG: DUF1553 domain-containing protein, partial [Gemmataceae bacterium]|nr:DUF1553 domain-containing protein [Gemmataceae bacterium]